MYPQYPKNKNNWTFYEEVQVKYSQKMVFLFVTVKPSLVPINKNKNILSRHHLVCKFDGREQGTN